MPVHTPSATPDETTVEPLNPSVHERVTFLSQGETIVGRFTPPEFGARPAPGVVVLGPENYQKEQAPAAYAERFAQLGYAALIFDPRYRGESGGEPRCYEDPMAKISDLRAAFDYLTSRHDVDSQRLALVGICFGGSYALRAAADDGRIGVIATVTAHLRDRVADVGWLGSDEVIAVRRARGVAALEKYRATGEVDYVPCVDSVRMDVGMPGLVPWGWYQPLADRGDWENRYAVMSDAPVLNYESLSAAARLTTPLLMVHSDGCAFPDAVHRHFAVVPTADKQLIWHENTSHLQYYDKPDLIDRTVWQVTDWFSRHLGPSKERND